MLKRIIDITASSSALIILMPVYIFIAYKVKKDVGSPVLFRQVRPGKKGEPFEMVKFRTMKQATDTEGNMLPDNDRLTPFGQKLRSTSLDELPELWNVVKGDMSLVGPRPLLMRYLPYFTEEEYKRFDLLPGITGLAQVNGRNYLKWDDRFQLDIEYVDNQSLWLDMKILFLTIKKVLLREEVAVVATTTMMDLDIERSANEN